MIWFTADTHYWHKNVIRYCERPFATIEEMNEKLIENHNSCVQDTDTVYHLGDFAMAGTKMSAEIKIRLKGKIHLVLGNHDYQNKMQKKALRLGFQSVEKHVNFVSEELGIVWLSHYPYRGLEADARTFEDQLPMQKKWLLHGHIHQHWKLRDNMVNVGVDVWDYKPVSIVTIKDLIAPTRRL